MVVFLMVVDLVVMEEVKDRRSLFMSYSCEVIFDSLVSPNLCMPYKIGTTVHEMVEPVRIQFYTNNGLIKVIQDII